MRELQEIAVQFLAVRERWQRQLAAEHAQSYQAEADTLPHEVSEAIRSTPHQSPTAAELERELCALAWVLGVDPDVDPQRLRERAIMHELLAAEAKEQGQPSPRVKLSVIRRHPRWLWLAEFPATSSQDEADEGGYTSGYWAAFITPRQLRELALAISKRFGSLGGDRPRGSAPQSLASYIAAERGTRERGTTPATGHAEEQP